MPASRDLKNPGSSQIIDWPEPNDQMARASRFFGPGSQKEIVNEEEGIRQ